MTADAQALAPSVRDTLTDWHRFVETKNGDVLRPLFAETTVFRSPFVHLPIPGPAASLMTWRSNSAPPSANWSSRESIW